jgi:hypothetical protein
MFITKALTKKNLESFIKQSFQFLNFSQASNLGDFLKGIGFYYATASGVSISIDDLKTPIAKKALIEGIGTDFDTISKNWSLGLVSDVERFQNIINNWNSGAEALKAKIIEHFQHNDPLNSLHIMAFSGARGNMSQVRQVIGMRGLMVNQEGDIIDLPIQANFREGLSSIDYIISSYGARKGVVDTALKTADAGYLTRRLIYIAQDITVKAIDCETSSKLSFFLNHDSFSNDLIGKTLVEIRTLGNKKISFLPFKKSLSEEYLKFLKTKGPLLLFYRSALTCKLKNGICQNCYGWNLANRKIIDLGLAAGTIAAQSIGEPGTQLTMRTFHTGGVFMGQFFESQPSPFSGLLNLPANIKATLARTISGKMVPLLLEDIKATITSVEGKEYEVFIPKSSFLYVKKSEFIKKGQILSELRRETKYLSEKKMHPIRAPFDAFILNDKIYEQLYLANQLTKGKSDNVIWLARGQLYSTLWYPKNLKRNHLSLNNAFASSKIVMPFQGISLWSSDKKKLIIKNHLKKAELNITGLNIESLIKGKVEIFLKNYQYLDPHTVIGYYYYYPNISGKIYKVKTNSKISKASKHSFFYITEKDTWKINFDTSYQLEKKEKIIFPKELLGTTIQSPSSGILLHKNGFQHVYQNAVALSVPKGALLSKLEGKFLKKDDVLAYLLVAKQKGEDIVQGLPKIEELLEARKAKKPALLFSSPFIFLGNWKTNPAKENLRFSKHFSKNFIYDVEILSESSKNFSFAIKPRKFALNANDPRSLRKVQKRQYILLNFFRGISPIKKLLIHKKAGHEALEFKKLEVLHSRDKSNSLSYPFLLNKFELPFSVSSFIRLPQFSLFSKQSNLSLKQINKDFYNKDALELISQFSKRKKVKYILPSVLIGLEKELTLNKSKQKLASHTLQRLDTSYSHFIAQSEKLKIKISEFVDIGRFVTEGTVDVHILLLNLFYYHLSLESLMLGTYKSIYKLHLILLNSIQSVYRSQGVEIANNHIELILRELTSKVKIKYCHNEIFYSNETISFSLISEICKLYDEEKRKDIFYEPMLFPISKAALHKEGFLTAAGFQETKLVLTKAAVEGKKDWVRGLKESVIFGRLVPAGTGFINSKNYLDTLYYYKPINYYENTRN